MKESQYPWGARWGDKWPVLQEIARVVPRTGRRNFRDVPVCIWGISPAHEDEGDMGVMGDGCSTFTARMVR